MRLVTVLAAVLSATPAFAADPVRVTASSLSVRSGPGTGYSVIGTAHDGESYSVIGTSGSWKKIWFDHRTGWVYGPYVVSSTLSTARVTASSLNVRTGPGTGYASVGTAPGGSSWAIAGTSGSWKKIYYGGAARYVHSSYLDVVGTTGGGGLPTSSAGFVQLPASGAGYYSYTTSARKWGTPRMIYGLMRAYRSWSELHDWPRIGVGDISDSDGGYLSGHASHRLGVDADMRPVASTGYEGALTRFSGVYSSTRTKDLITHHLKVELPVKVIFFNDPRITPLSYVQTWPNHDNHLHVRIY